MSRIRKHLPSPAMIVAIVALVAASAGTSFAAIGLGGLSKRAKNETVGVGKLTYVGRITQGTGNAIPVHARCPRGLRLIGGGVHTTDPARSEVEESHPATHREWEAVVKANGTESIEVLAICAKSRVVKTLGERLPPSEAH